MSKPNTINSLEEALRILWLERIQDVDFTLSEREVKLILTSSDTFDMSQAKREELVNKLFETVNNVSMGYLISEKIAEKQLKEEDLALETKLPLPILQGVKADSVFPNNIPVLLLKGLLVKLDIPFKSAENAIRKTFELIQKRSLINLDPSSYKVAARRRQDEKERFFVSKRGESDGRELYENKDSLAKYLAKLEYLMTNSKG